MMLRRGDYVLCNFPFRESPGPEPSPHIVLCAATGRQGNVDFAIVFYTTSQTEFQGQRRPRQYLLVDKTRALQLGQKTAFHVDASRIARLPLTRDYFPEMAGNTIPVRGNDAEFVTRVEERLRELVAGGFQITKIDGARQNKAPPRAARCPFGRRALVNRFHGIPALEGDDSWKEGRWRDSFLA